MAMTSRERLIKTLNHESPDKIPFDLGATAVTGIHASTLDKLRVRYGITDGPVRIHEPYQLLGEVDIETADALKIDIMGIFGRKTFFGFPNQGWHPWTMPDGTHVLVPELFKTTTDSAGNQYLYPEGDLSVKPSGILPQNGFYFDALVRQEAYNPAELKPEEWIDGMFGEFDDEDLAHFEKSADYLFKNTSKGIILGFGQGGFGDIAFVPGPWMKFPKGIRSIEDWYMAPVLYPDYIRGIFELQCNIALKNLILLRQAVGEKIQAIFIGGTDYGSQSGPMVSPDWYRENVKPLHRKLNDWIHKNTSWKTFIHSCGSVVKFLDDFVEAGFDILNPVQCSAVGMDPAGLKDKYGKKLVFWGGGIDTQKVLPFGTPEEVAEQVRERIRVLGKDGGFVFNAIHNIQHGVPVENLVAMLASLEKYRSMHSGVMES